MLNLLFENISHEDLKFYIQEYYNFANNLLNFKRNPKVILKKDEQNSKDILGKTGYYNPETEEICLFITNRHGKDILRSFAHELIHHDQKLNGFNDNLNISLTASDPSYMLHDEGLKEMERDAFERGNMMFRTWTDTKKMEKRNMLNEKAKMPMKKDVDDVDSDGDTNEKVPAYLDKGDIKKKKTSGKVPPQLAKYIKKENNMKVKASSKKMHQEGAENLLEVEDEEEMSVDDMMAPKYGPGMSDFDKTAGLRAGSVDDSEEASIDDLDDLEIDDEEEGEVEVAPKRSSAPVEKDQDARIANQLRSRYPELYRQISRELSPEDAYLQRKGAEDMYDEDEYGRKAMRGPKGPLPEEQLEENKKNPYPPLFEKRDRLLNEVFKTKEERVYNELIRRFIKK